MAVEVLSEFARNPAVPASVRVRVSVAILEQKTERMAVCRGRSSASVRSTVGAS